MNEENLRQAILAIAVNIDYKKEEYTKNLTDETANNDIGDPAFLILSGDLIRDFKDAWRNGIPSSKMAETVGTKLQGPTADSMALAVVGGVADGVPPLKTFFGGDIIRGLIVYVSLELSWSIYHLPFSSTMEMLLGRYHEIKRRFVQSPSSEMFVELASRECVYEAIKVQLRRNNNDRTSRMYNIINNSNRPQAVFDMFKKAFAERSASAFYFSGTFLSFLMFTYNNYFYNTVEKSAIWSELRSQDIAKAEQELDVHNLRYNVDDTEQADLYIHDLAVSIGEANTQLFKHTGQAKDDDDPTCSVNGLMYDICYLILSHLVKQKLDEINAKLTSVEFQFKDPWAWHIGKRNNKNVKAKIDNAKQLIPLLWEHVRSGNFNTTKILDLRREAYKLGRSDTQGRNPVWDSEGKLSEGEASFYMDTPDGKRNLEAFDIVLKGVISVHSFLRALAGSGKDLVHEYIASRGYYNDRGKWVDFSCWFTNSNVYRHLDYMSSLKYVTQMVKLQQEANQGYEESRVAGGAQGTGELLNFDDMVSEYAGSDKHTERHIIENRKWAQDHGLLSQPRTKEKNRPLRPYEKKLTVTRYITAFPYTYRELETERDDSASRQMFSAGEVSGFAPREFPDGHMMVWRGPAGDADAHIIGRANYSESGAGTYVGFKHNVILQNAEWYAREHLRSESAFASVGWHIGTHKFGGLVRTMEQFSNNFIDQSSDRVVPGAIALLTSYMHVSTEETQCATHFDRHGQLSYDFVTRSNEREWLIGNDTEDINGDGPMQHLHLYGAMPNSFDVHTVLLLNGVKPEQYNSITRDEIINSGMCAHAQELLQNSLGFELYIGLDNLHSADIRGKLNSIKVWEDYREQVTTYYNWLVELNWMQEAHIRILEMMWETCWYITSPGSMDNFSTEDYKHAKNLINSLVKKRFSRDDVTWFFDYLVAKYTKNGRALPKHLWPDRIVSFDARKDVSQNHEPIIPKWALMLKGPFDGWVELFGLKPDTQFEDGPYNKFMASIAGVKDVAEQFVLLHAFLYEKTLYLKVLRDSYCIIFNGFGEDNDTLGCELDSQLGIMDTFNANNAMWGKGVAALRRCSVDLNEYIISQVTYDNVDFEVLLTALREYFSSCAAKLQKMVNYDVSATEEQASQFDKWGNAFANINPIVDSDTLNRIRGRYTVDSNGFVCGFGGYFTIRYGEDLLYLHQSGAFLRKSKNGQYNEFMLRRETSDEINEYESVLQGGIRNASATVQR